MNTEASDVNSITLRDGRTLAYAEYGDPDGKPVFYFHGTPGSRLEHHPDDAIARERGARIITADRPGFGHSDFQLHRTFLDWPDDVVQLADALHSTIASPLSGRRTRCATSSSTTCTGSST